MKIFKFRCLEMMMVCTLLFTNVIGQKKEKWEMQPIGISTPWAAQVNAANPLPEYPRPQMVRSNWQTLNGIWQYAITENDALMPQKYTGEILVPYPLESALSGVEGKLLPHQALWYKRSIVIPRKKSDKRILLHFGAVDYQTVVYVNNKEIGNHTGGYTNFSFDVTSVLKEGPNEIVVKVVDPTDKGVGPYGKQAISPSSIYYTSSSGIWQTVWLEETPRTYIESIKLRPDIDSESLFIKVRLSGDVLSFQTNDRYKVKITATSKGKIVKTLNCKMSSEFKVDIPNGHLWSPEDPFLYDLSVQLQFDGRPVDEIKSYFGMRKINIRNGEDGLSRIYLNNKYTYNLGVLEQGFWPEGLYTPPTDEAMKFDIEVIKAMGFNTIRKHIKVEAARWYFHCDKLGMLVWQDMVNPNPDLPAGAKPAFEQQMKETVDQLYNYPSITTWVLFNEKWGQYDQQRLTQWLKEYDPSRLVNGHSGELLYVDRQLRSPSPNAFVSSNMTDIHSYPFPYDFAPSAGKANVIGEFGGIGVNIEDHIWDDLSTGWGYNGLMEPDEFKSLYQGMVDSLKFLERKGLSASIYTQPYDVESERNGLLTYDRKIAKVSLSEIKEMNARLLPSMGSFKFMRHVDTAGNKNNDYAERLLQYKAGKKDSAFLRSLALSAHGRKDEEVAGQVANDYIKQIRDPFQKRNIRFVRFFTKSTNSIGFDIIKNNTSKVNEVLGEDVAEGILLRAIEADEITPYIREKGVIGWDAIRSRVVNKYGALGEEAVLQAQVLYSADNGDWKLFKSVGKTWFEKYGKRRSWVGMALLNNIAWSVFETSTDVEVLETALLLSEKSIQNTKEANFLDTYANLLYKLGRKQNAIEWEEKALSFDLNNDAIKKSLHKMKTGVPTWQ